MLISIEELKTHLADYQVDQITGNDDTIVSDAIATAEAEVASYLATRYDTAAIFAATGTDRHALVVNLVKVCAAHHLLLLSNVDAIYERYEKAYDRALDYLRQVADGSLAPALPPRTTSSGNRCIKM